MVGIGAAGLMLLMLAISTPKAFASSVYPYLGVTLGSPLTSINKISDSSTTLNTDFDPGLMAGVTAGIAFDAATRFNVDRIRTEVEIAHRSSELASMNNAQGQSGNIGGTLTMTTYMFNVYLDNTDLQSKSPPLNLFITAGIGAAMASITTVSYQNKTLIAASDDTQIAYQGGLGVGIGCSKNIMMDLAYKYMATNPFNFAGVRAEYGSHNMLVSARYAFK